MQCVARMAALFCRSLEQACSQSMADAAGEKGTDEEYVAHLVSLIMTRAVAQAEGGPQ